VRKEEVKVQIEDGNLLQISSNIQKKNKMRQISGIDTKGAARRFRLPENAKVDDIKCSLEHGVLTVCVPKHVSDQDKTKNVRSIDIGI
ncbi:hypothetical protein MKW92_047566, partial [Papaver armeniacum]